MQDTTGGGEEREQRSGVETVERREHLSYAEFVEGYCVPRRPVIPTGAIGHWAALGKWSPEYFAAQVGDKRVEIDRHPDFARAQQITLTLQEREVVFMPAGWWHTTRMPGSSISVTWNMVNSTNWPDVAADTRRRVERKTNGLVASVFGLYAGGFQRAKATLESRTAG